jgi:hypothetical protein
MAQHNGRLIKDKSIDFSKLSDEGTSGQVLTSNGAGQDPTWQESSGGSGSNPEDMVNFDLLEANTGITLVSIGNLKNIPQFSATGISSVDTTLKSVPKHWNGTSDFRLRLVFQTTGTSGGNLHLNFKYGIQGSNEAIDGTTFTRTVSNNIPITTTSGAQVIVESEILGVFNSDITSDDTFYCQIEVDRDDAGNTHTDAINLLSAHLIFNDSVSLNDQGALLLDANTLTLWKFENTSSNGNETGYADGSSGGTLNLNYVSGTIGGAVSTSPPTNGVDDGLYRNFSSTSYMQALQTYFSSSVTAFTIEAVVRLDNLLAYIIYNSVSPSTPGFLLFNESGTDFRFAVYDGSSNLFNLTLGGNLGVTTGKWYHVVAMKNSNDYYLGASDILTQGHIKSASDWASLPAGQKATTTNAGTWTPSTPERVGYIASQSIQGDIDWIRFSDSARYI